jgi:hypothetical protein
VTVLGAGGSRADAQSVTQSRMRPTANLVIGIAWTTYYLKDVSNCETSGDDACKVDIL